MDIRAILFIFASLYYIIELSVLCVQGQPMFLTAVESLMLVASCLTLTRISRGDSKSSRLIIFINSCLFGLTIGWLCYAAFNVDDDAGVPIFLSLNGMVVLLLTFIDMRYQQSVVSHDVMGADTAKEFPANACTYLDMRVQQGVASHDVMGADTNETPSNVSSKDNTEAYFDDTISTRNPQYYSTAQGNRKDVEAGPESDYHGPSRLSANDDIFDGFRVKLEKLPISNSSIPDDVPWESFSYIEHRVDSSSCHIYSAFWRGTAVIIKLIKADRVSSPMAVAEFETEASVLSRLDHPHIVRLLGSGRIPRRFLILELLDGGTLSHSLGLRAGANNRLIKKKFTYLETLLLARSLASSLDYLHNRWHSSIHVIHRDLKPDNIGFTADGKLKLFDFGLCACVRTNADRRDQYRLTGNTGTLRYMAPEVALGRQYNSSVDVYSFGVIVWQVLRSKVPFRDMGKKAYIQEVVVGGKRPQLDRRWPAGFSSLLQQCWHEDKDSRPSFAQVVSELNSLILEAQGRSSVSMNMQVSYKIRKVKSKFVEHLVRFRPYIASAAVALAVVSVVILLLGGRVIGSSLAAVSTAVLYLAGMSYIKGPTGPEEAQKGLGLRQRMIMLFGRGRRRSSAASLMELKKRPNDPHALASSSPISPSGTCASACLGKDDPTVSFNPLSPHSVHHSSEGDELEGYYRRPEGRDREGMRPAAMANV